MSENVSMACPSCEGGWLGILFGVGVAMLIVVFVIWAYPKLKKVMRE